MTLGRKYGSLPAKPERVPSGLWRKDQIGGARRRITRRNCSRPQRGCGCACADEGAVNVLAWLVACSRWAARLRRKIWARRAQSIARSRRRSANLFGPAFSRRLCHRQFEKGKIPGWRCRDRHRNESEIFPVASKPSPCASRAPANRRPPPSPGATRDRKSFGKRHGFACCSWADDNEATNLRNRNPDLTLLPGHQG